MHRDTRQCRGVLAGCGHMDSAVLRRLAEPHPRLRLTPENTGHLRREKSVDRFTFGFSRTGDDFRRTALAKFSAGVFLCPPRQS